MKSGDGIIVSCIKALGASITSPYPYYGLLAVLEYLALSALLAKETLSTPQVTAFVITTAFLVTIALVVSRLIEKVGHDKMLSSEVLIKLAEIDAKLKLSEAKAKKGGQS
jgi:hypothetical protein